MAAAASPQATGREEGRRPLTERPTDFSDPDALSFEFALDASAQRRLRELAGAGLSAAELGAKFSALGHDPDDAESAAELFRLLDTSGDGQVDLAELLGALRDLQAARASFANIDRKGRGYVSLATVANGLWLSSQPDVRRVARETAPSLEQLAALVRAYDGNGNGVMERPEFVAMFIDFRRQTMGEASARGEPGRARISQSIHAWSELEWLADELGLGAQIRPAASAPAWTKFAVAGLGGASGWLVVHPLDVAKTRAQLSGGGSAGLLGTLRAIYAADGLRGFGAGLSAAMARQFSYTTARVGLYDTLREWAGKRLHSNEEHAGGAAGFALSLGCGLAAGGIAAALCCPVEVALVRMQADSLAPLPERRNYRHVGHALRSILAEVAARTRAAHAPPAPAACPRSAPTPSAALRRLPQEGLAAGWRGVGATVGRGMLVSMTQLSTYDLAKQTLRDKLRLAEGVRLHLAAAVASGFAYSAVSLPVDNAKTRLQHQRPRPDGSLPLRSMLHAIRHTAATEGVGALWCARAAPAGGASRLAPSDARRLSPLLLPPAARQARLPGIFCARRRAHGCHVLVRRAVPRAFRQALRRAQAHIGSLGSARLR